MQLPEHRYINSEGIVAADQILEQLTDPAFLPDENLDIGLITAAYPSPEWPIETALCERFEVAKNPAGMPYTTFATGGALRLLERTYSKNFLSDSPPIIVARLAISRLYVDATYIMPVVATGSTNKAVIASCSYAPKTLSIGGRSGRFVRQLSRYTSSKNAQLIPNNPFAPNPASSKGNRVSDRSFDSALHTGRLGTI